jgi:neutral ceramidase
MITDAIKTIVIEKLKQLYGNLYVTENVMLSGTHTHAGPGGYSWSLHSPFLSFFHSF